MTTLYTDEDSSHRALVTQLRLHGRTVWTPAEVDQLERTDEGQLVFADGRRWVIFTCNTDDFARLHSSWMRDGRGHAGIIILNEQQLDVGLQLRALELLLDSIPEQDWANRMEYLLPWARRVLESG